MPRQTKPEDKQLNYFIKKDRINSFSDFFPDNELHKKYENIVISRQDDKFVCIFMSKDFKESFVTIIVYDKCTLCSPLIFFEFALH